MYSSLLFNWRPESVAALTKALPDLKLKMRVGLPHQNWVFLQRATFEVTYATFTIFHHTTFHTDLGDILCPS
jgi:hypothetical protein